MNDKIIVKKVVCFPTTTQILLLKAALFEPNEAIQYWHQWILVNDYIKIDYNSPDFLPNFFDPLDVGSMNIMPLVYKNLGDFTEPVIQRLNGHYRKNWFDNTRLQNHTKQFI